jgi:hypothetical protein
MSRQINVEPLKVMLIEDVEPSYLSKILDDVAFQYASYLICDTDLRSPQGAEQIYFLRKLRDALIEVAE